MMKINELSNIVLSLQDNLDTFEVPALTIINSKNPAKIRFLQELISTEGDDRLLLLEKLNRIEKMIDTYQTKFGQSDVDVSLVSAPGRLEILGNFQDNGHGVTLSAAIRNDVLALAGKGRGSMQITDHHYDGDLNKLVHTLPDFGAYVQNPSDVKWHGQPIGIGYQLKQIIPNFSGVDMVLDGEVPDGSGCSSSAASENAITMAIANVHYKNLSIHEIARISKRAENLWRGKGCGWLDQLTSMVGGIALIDYSNADEPAFTQINKPLFPGYKFVTVMADKEGHGNLDHKYNEIRKDLDKMASKIGWPAMKGDALEYFMRTTDLISDLEDNDRMRYGLRAHFFIAEYQRVLNGLAALELGDAKRFGQLMSESGKGSKDLLLNTNPTLDLAVRRGEEFQAYGRVHGGGFKGGVIFLTEHPDVFASSMQDFYDADDIIIHDIRKGACDYTA